MRLSASILDDFPVCGFKTKLRYLDRVEMPLTVQDIAGMYFGRLAHAGQDAILGVSRNGPPLGAEYVVDAIHTAAAKELGDRLPKEAVAGLVVRATLAVERWRAYFRPEQYEPQIVNQKFIIRLPEPIGVFDEVVLQPDLVCSDHTGPYLFDWKWVTTLGSAEEELDALRFDLQSAVYQYGLALLGRPVHRVGHVRGMRENPTPFRVNKDGRVSTRPIRNSAEAYEAACKAAGHEPNPEFGARLMPFFRSPVIYRGPQEVEAVWRNVVVPRALEVSAAMEKGFTRRWSRFACMRCPYQSPCAEGVMGRGEGPFATALPFTGTRAYGFSDVTAAEL